MFEGVEGSERCFAKIMSGCTLEFTGSCIVCAVSFPLLVLEGVAEIALFSGKRQGVVSRVLFRIVRDTLPIGTRTFI